MPPMTNRGKQCGLLQLKGAKSSIVTEWEKKEKKEKKRKMKKMMTDAEQGQEQELSDEYEDEYKDVDVGEFAVSGNGNAF